MKRLNKPLSVMIKNFYRGKDIIYGELFIPSIKKDKYPLVILSHGFTGSKESNRFEAIELTKLGYMTYIYDFINGGSHVENMSVLTEAQDLNIVINGLKELDNVSDIYLLGKSQGGFVSSYVASFRDDIKNLILYYPAFVIRDDVLKRLGTSHETNVMGHKISPMYNEDALSFDIYDVIKEYKNKVLIIHGDKDSIVPLSYSIRAEEVFPNARLLVINGAGHGYLGKARDLAFSYVRDFLSQI